MTEPAEANSDPIAPITPQHGILRGPNGLRAGWRAIIFVLIAAGLFLLIAIPVSWLSKASHVSVGGIGMLTPFGLGLSEATILFFVLLATLIMRRYEERPFGDYGLPLKYAFREHFWMGALIGFAAISFCLLAIFLLHGFRVTGMAISGSTIFTATLAWSLTFLIVGLSEEFAFRGYLQFTLTTGMGFWPAAILLSVMFGLAHSGNPGETRLGLFSVVLFGLLFCLFLQRTGNLWYAVGFHAGWDWGQTFFYGVRDSGAPAYHNLLNSSFSGPAWLTGGSVGPEASLFAPITLALVGVFFNWKFKINRYSMTA